MHTIIVMFIVGQYELAAEKKWCTGYNTGGYHKTIEECVIQCKNKASMFVYGQGSSGCEQGLCFCVCIDGTCNQVSNPAYNVYRIITKGKKL